MELCCEVKMGMSLIQKVSGKEFNIDKSIKKVYDEYSEEYKELARQFTNEIGFTREFDEDKFDEKLLMILVSEAKKQCVETIGKLSSIVKDAYQNDKNGWIEFGGYIVNLQDFSGVCFNKLETNISKN